MNRGVAMIVAATVFASIMATGAYALPAALGTKTPPAAWNVTTGPRNVPLGASITLVVFGPRSAQFDVYVYVQPFNYTPPVEEYYYSMPSNASVGGEAMLNLSVPTSDLYVGQALVRVLNVSLGLLLNDIFEIGVPLSSSMAQMQSDINNLQALYNASLAHIQFLQNQGASQYAAAQRYNQAMVSLFLGSLLGIGVIEWLASPSSETNAWARILKSIYARLTRTDTWVTPGYAGVTSETPSRPRPSRFYLGTMYPNCIGCQVPQDRGGIVFHYQTIHGVKMPRQGLHYRADRGIRRTLVAQAAPMAPDVGTALRAIQTLDTTGAAKFGSKE